MFSLEYAEVTRTASDTFHDRQGNCLSFTMLFVGLARAAGLTANYQSVEVPPTWANDGQVVIASHVNAVVRTGFGEETVVDFNIRAATGDQAESPRQRHVCARAVLYELRRRSAAARRVRREPRLFARGRAGVSQDRRAVGESWACCTRATVITSTRRRRICARSKSTRTSDRRSPISCSSTTRSASASSRQSLSRTRAGLSRAQSLLSLRVGHARLRAAAVLGSARVAAQGAAAQARRARVLHVARASVDGARASPATPSRASSARASIEAIEYARTESRVRLGGLSDP